MNRLITDNMNAIRNLAQRFGVARLEVFGSVCTANFDQTRSDVDFIVEYPPDKDLGPWMAVHFALQEQLQAMLGREVELFSPTFLQDNWVRAEAAKTRTVLYEAPGYLASAIDLAVDEPLVLRPDSGLHPKSPKWLSDARDASAFLLEQLSDMSLDDYRTDRQLRAVVDRKLSVIGVALSGLRRVDPATFDTLPDAQKFIDIGEHVIHDYDAVDRLRVWTVIDQSLQALSNASNQLIASAVRVTSRGAGNGYR